MVGERHSLRQASCPFCRIAEGHGEGCTPRILFQNERVAAFEDRKPAALRHYLVVPLTHVKDITQLQQGAEHHALVAEMVKVGRSLLQRDAQSTTSFRLGFHRPPFNSVPHLHLHCQALPYKPWWRAAKHVALGWWGAYIKVEDLLARLQPKL